MRPSLKSNWKILSTNMKVNQEKVTYGIQERTNMEERQRLTEVMVAMSPDWRIRILEGICLRRQMELQNRLSDLTCG